MRKQYVLSAPGRILVGFYTTKSGQVKNRYRTNPDARVIGLVKHNPIR